MRKIIKKLEKQFILCDAVDDSQIGQGVYSDDSGEGENDFNEEEVTDPEAEADSNLDAEPDPANPYANTTYTDNGEMEIVVEVPGGTNPIDPVPVETTPVEDEENQEGDPGADSDVTDDPNWGMDDSGNSTESEGDVEEEEFDDEDDYNLDEYILLCPFAQIEGKASKEEKEAVYIALLTMPSAFRNIELIFRFNNQIDTPGRYLCGGIVEFRSKEDVSKAIFEECFHAYQEVIKGWNLMCDTRAETEFEAKMITALMDYTTKEGCLTELGSIDAVITLEDGSQVSVIYHFFDVCFSGADTSSSEFKNDPWQFFDEDAFLDGFADIFELWLNSPTGYDQHRNDDYDWGYWSYWIDILRNY